MSINPTLNYLKSEQSLVVLCFADMVTTSDKYIRGAGNISGDGYPMPIAGKIEGILIYDGSNVTHGSGEIKFDAEDRLSVYAVHDLSEFTVYVRKNGINTAVSAGGLPENANYFVTVTVRLTE